VLREQAEKGVDDTGEVFQKGTGVDGFLKHLPCIVLCHTPLPPASLPPRATLPRVGTPFQQAVWQALRRIPRGRVATYGDIACAIGKPSAFRAVGTAVGKNPDAPRTPCHRVVLGNGHIGNYSGPGGATTKVQLLQQEGVVIARGRVVDFAGKRYPPL